VEEPSPGVGDPVGVLVFWVGGVEEMPEAVLGGLDQLGHFGVSV
jgi:hypothetical protein